MIPTVVCVYFDGTDILPDYSGGVYDWSWVEKLYNGVRRNTDDPFKFLCLTDQPRPHDLPTAIHTVDLFNDTRGWMCINEIFRPDLNIERGIFMGLDTVILGDITHILGWDGEFGVTRSPYLPKTLCNAVVSFNKKWAGYLWKIWNKRKAKWTIQCANKGFVEGLPSEVSFLRLNKNEEWEFLDDYFPNQISSWKTGKMSEETRILYFHGNPKPPDIEDKIVLEAWV